MKKTNLILIYDDLIAVLQDLPEDCSYDELYAYFAQLDWNGYDAARIPRYIPEDLPEQIRKNLFVVNTLIFLLTGKYPEEIWGADAVEAESVVTNYRRIHDEYIAACAKLSIPPALKALNDKAVDFTESAIRGILVQKFLAVAPPMFSPNLAEFLTETCILKEKFFAAKAYNAVKWIGLLQKEKQRFIQPTQTDLHMTEGKFDFHATTMQGNNHTKCDDYSLAVQKLVPGMWFACSADGVGSAPLSHLGSRYAAECFRDCLATVATSSPAKIMEYIQKQLVIDASKKWRDRLHKSIVADMQAARPKYPVKLTQDEVDYTDYASTFLFAFGCSTFIACGIVGDGNFIVEKIDSSSGTAKYGYVSLNDGVSDVVQKSVLNMVHLKTNPQAMRITFFNPKEVSGILMSSDGANGLTFRNIGGALIPHSMLDSPLNAASFMEALRTDTFEACSERVRMMCARFSDSNKFSGGRGDDCSLVYVRRRDV